MSEYQYYEFLALDSPLESSEIAALRAISSRAEVSATRFSNVYNYGDFRGSPEKLMERYFDAHLYVANWGTYTFMIRLPRGSVDETLSAAYGVKDRLKFWTTNEHLIVQWQRNDEEPPDEWVEGAGWMARLIGIRDELVRGDFRALYLGWLYGVQDTVSMAVGDRDDAYGIDDAATSETIEPVVPPGLGSATAAQSALIEFLDIDQDLVAAAAKASADVATAADLSLDMEQWVSRLAVEEARPYLLLLMQGKARQAEAQIRHAYTIAHRSSASTSVPTAAERRSIAGLRALRAATVAARQAREAEQKQQKREKKRQEREQYLSKMAIDVERHWKQVAELVALQNASAYDKVRDLLVDLSEAATLVNKRNDFAKRFNQFCSTYSRRSALMKRLEKAKLTG